MKKMFISMIALLGVGMAHADVETPFLECKPSSTKGPSYVVSTVSYHIPSLKESWRLKLSEKSSVSVGLSDPVRYGDTLIFTLNSGRSGYIHLYWHRDPNQGDTSLIDINLYQASESELNTRGPITDYRCHLTDDQ